MLEIEDVTLLPDGRSLVNTIGGRRFKVIETICCQQNIWNFSNRKDNQNRPQNLAFKLLASISIFLFYLIHKKINFTIYGKSECVLLYFKAFCL